MAEWETLVEFLDSLVLARASAGAGVGVVAVRVRGTRLGASVSCSALGSLHSRFHCRVWTVDFLVAPLGLVFLALFWPSSDGFDLWIWIGLGLTCEGGIPRVWQGKGRGCCFAFG